MINISGCLLYPLYIYSDPCMCLALQAPHFHTTYIEELVFCTREDNNDNVNKKHSPNPSKKVVIKFRENTRIQVFAA